MEDCVGYFERLAEVAFAQRFPSWLRWIWQIRAVLASLFTDGMYPAQALENILQDVFGSERGILDYSHATAAGTKIGITVSSMKPEPFLFTNYNGVGDRHDEKYRKYRVLLGNAPVWQMQVPLLVCGFQANPSSARSTSAAPG